MAKRRTKRLYNFDVLGTGVDQYFAFNDNSDAVFYRNATRSATAEIRVTPRNNAGIEMDFFILQPAASRQFFGQVDCFAVTVDQDANPVSVPSVLEVILEEDEPSES